MTAPAQDGDDPLAAARRLGRRFRETAADLDAGGAFPRANIGALSDAGLLNLVIDHGRGGLGGGLTLARRVVSEIARGEPSTALILSMHLVNHAAIRFGGHWPEAAARRLIADSLAGPALVNSLQVEPEAGSPSYGNLPRTVARRDGDVWRLSGRKRFATGCEGLAWSTVSAVTDEPEPRVGLFIVSHATPGITIDRTWNSSGMRATGSHDVVFDDVAVPLDHTIDLAPAAHGLRRDERLGTWFMLLIGAVYHGIARAARDDGLAFATRFRPGGGDAPLSDLPRIRDALGAVEVALVTNERLLDSVAQEFDAGGNPGQAGGIVRHVVFENAVTAVEQVIGIVGNAGVSRDHPFERHHRNVVCARTHAPATPLIRAAAARAALASLSHPV